jgi:hypothetical protein
LLVFMWTLLAALGLSNLRYSETGSSRNVLIVGFSLFLSLSVPAYFQQYSPTQTTGLPAYFQQFAIPVNGPIHTKSANVSTTFCNHHLLVIFARCSFYHLVNNNIQNYRVLYRSSCRSDDPSLSHENSDKIGICGLTNCL